MELCGAEHPDQHDIVCNQELGHRDRFHIAALGVNHMVSWPNLDYIDGPKNLQEFNSTALGMAQDSEDETHAREPDPPHLYFDGITYEAEFDEHRLGIQHHAVWRVIQDGEWRIPEEVIATIVVHGGRQYATAAITARIRDFRKPRFGGWTVERRARGDRHHGLFEYRVLRSDPVTTRISAS
jgi:hypothetical protein